MFGNVVLGRGGFNHEMFRLFVAIGAVFCCFLGNKVVLDCRSVVKHLNVHRILGNHIDELFQTITNF